ncbi:MAG: phosphorylase [Phormidesmis sp.]
MSKRINWEPGHLWQKLKAQSEHGLKTGALEPIDTDAEYIDTGNVRFVVRVLANLVRKEKAIAQQGNTRPANPFLPYDTDLYVTDISETHLCLLNKFNVVDHHFLIVTRAFEPQENWLTLADFEALARCLAEVDGLGFFNGGVLAGSSQPHKHLQVVPHIEEESIERSDTSADLLIEAAIASAIEKEEGIWRSPTLPLRHAIVKFSAIDNNTSDHIQIAQRLLRDYQKLLSAVGIASAANWKGPQTAAYNLLCSRRWMMVVARSQEKYAGISINSLGFAGSLLVKDRETLCRLKEIGPLKLLQKVSYEISTTGTSVSAQ